MTTATKSQLTLHCINESRVDALFTIEPLSGYCVHVDARCIAKTDERRSLTVNGVELEFWARFYKQTNGLWDWMDYDGHPSYNMQKPWEINRRFEDASRVAVKKVRLMMADFLNKWERTEKSHQALCGAESKSLTELRKLRKGELTNTLLTVERIKKEILELTTKLASVK